LGPTRECVSHWIWRIRPYNLKLPIPDSGCIAIGMKKLRTPGLDDDKSHYLGRVS